MEEVDTVSIASEDTIKSLIDNFRKTNNILRKAKDQIKNGFKNMEQEQEDLIAKNGVLDVYGSEIVKIKSGGGASYP